MSSNKIKISLDSSIFRDIDFVEWLQLNSERFHISISVIVYLETYHWYNLRGIDKNLFEEEMSALNGKINDLYSSEVENISNNAIKSNLLFKHHARDLIIATHAIKQDSVVITLNKRHFDWMDAKPMSPDELILSVK